MSAARTELLGSFLKEDLDPSVAANLCKILSTAVASRKWVTHHNSPKPLSLFVNSSGEKNMRDRACARADVKDRRGGYDQRVAGGTRRGTLV